MSKFRKFAIESRVVCILAMAGSAILPLPAAAQSAPTMGNQMKTSAQGVSDGGIKMRKSMDDMHLKMGNMKMSGDVDYDFIMMMRAHHEAALEMAQIEVDNGKDPAAIKAAKKIISAQKKEITEFDAWLAKHPMK